MQFIQHRDPVNVGGWSTALGATGDAINNVLSIYAGYQKQKKDEAQLKLENEWKKQEIEDRRKERERQAALDQLNVEIKRRDLELQAAKEGLPGARPTTKAEKQYVQAGFAPGPVPMPLFVEVPDVPKAPEGAAPDDQKPVATQSGASPGLTGMSGANPFFNPDVSPEDSTAVDLDTRTEVVTPPPTPPPATPPPATPPPTEFGFRVPIETPAPTERRTVRGITYNGQEFAPDLSYDVKYADEIRKEKEAADLEKQITEGSMTRLTEEEKRQFQASGDERLRALASRGVMPTSTYNALMKRPGVDRVDKIFDKATGKYYAFNEKTGRYDTVVAQVSPEKTAGTGNVADMYGGSAGEERLASIREKDPRRAALLEGMLSGKVDPYKTSSLRGTDRANMIADAQLIDPTYDPSAAQSRVKTRQDFTTGAAGKNIRSINTAIKHIDTLDNALKKIGLTRFPWVNKAANWFRTQTGDPSIARLQTAALAVATEMAAALKGGNAAPTTQEINEQLATISSISSPDQWRAVLESRAELLAGRLTTLQEQYAQAFGGRSPDRPFIFAETAKVLRGLGLADKFGIGEDSKGNGEGAGGGKPKDPAGIR